MCVCGCGTGNKLRHSLEPNKYPYVSPSMVNLREKEDLTHTARYPLVKAHGLFSQSQCSRVALNVDFSIMMKMNIQLFNG